METIRVLIADDHPLFRDGPRTLLESVPDMQVIGEAATGDEALAQATTLQPDVILMDIKMPGMNGIEATRRILQTSPHICILMFTMFEDDETVFAAMRAGARGYLLKGAVQEKTLHAIRAVASGEAVFGPTVAKRLMHYFGSMRPAGTSGAAQFFPELTEREYEILVLCAWQFPRPVLPTNDVESAVAAVVWRPAAKHVWRTELLAPQDAKPVQHESGNWAE